MYISQIKWLHVGVFNGENEDIHNGYVYQTDHSGIKISLLVVDPESGVSKINIRVGTSPGNKITRNMIPILPPKTFKRANYMLRSLFGYF